MRINLLVEYEDGEKQEVVCSAGDLVKFEEKYDISIARIQDEMKLTHLLFLAHSSLVRQKQTKLAFDAWVETVLTIGASEKDPK